MSLYYQDNYNIMVMRILLNRKLLELAIRLCLNNFCHLDRCLLLFFRGFKSESATDNSK